MSSIVLTRPVSTGTNTSNTDGLSTSVVNGQPMLTLVDTTRSDKVLSISEQVLVFTDNVVSHLGWLKIATAADADSGFIADFDGTVTSITAHCENTMLNAKDIQLYIDNVNVATVASLTGGDNAIDTDQTLNFDFTRGQRIRLRGFGITTGNINDTVVKLSIKWRSE